MHISSSACSQNTLANTQIITMWNYYTVIALHNTWSMERNEWAFQFAIVHFSEFRLILTKYENIDFSGWAYHCIVHVDLADWSFAGLFCCIHKVKSTNKCPHNIIPDNP